MSLYRYFQRQGGLPSTKETGLTPLATAEANKVVEKVINSEAAHGSTRKRRYITTYTGEDRAKIGRYAAENGNTMAVKHFKASYEDLAERSCPSHHLSMYDYLRSRPEIIINGFKKAGIIQAIEEGPDKEVPLEFESDDPFADLSD